MFTIKFEKFRTLYYEGKYSTLVTLKDSKQMKPAFNFFKKNINNFKNILGFELDVHKVISNNVVFYQPSSSDGEFEKDN